MQQHQVTGTLLGAQGSLDQNFDQSAGHEVGDFVDHLKAAEYRNLLAQDGKAKVGLSLQAKASARRCIGTDS